MENFVLLSLPPEERACVVDYSTMVSLEQHSVIYSSGQRIEHVYFLEAGVVSLLTTAPDGRAIKTGVVGREGIVGGTIVLGPPQPDGQAIVQISGRALRAPATKFLLSYGRLPNLTSLVNWHIGFLLFQAQQNALCHAIHSIEARFCGWVLQASDRLDGNVLDLTQEACSQILGVQRTSVSMVAHTLQLAGIIRTRRGRIEILDRARLQNGACECYRQVKQRLETAYSKAA